MLEKSTFGGQITYSPKIENYPGTMQMSGNEFADRLVEQVFAQGADIEMETVTAVKDHGGTKQSSRRTARMTAAASSSPRACGTASSACRGKTSSSAKASLTARCVTARVYKEQHVAVIGGGNSALQEAILLSETCREVTVVQNLPFLTGEKSLCDARLPHRKNVKTVLGTVVSGLVGDTSLTALELRREETGEEFTLPVDSVFVAIGLEPVNDAFADVAALDERGYFASDGRVRQKRPAYSSRRLPPERCASDHNRCCGRRNGGARRVPVSGQLITYMESPASVINGSGAF